MDSFVIKIQDLVELEHYTNLKEAHLRWLVDSSVKEALLMLKRYTNLRRLTLAKWKELFFPTSEELCDFIMELKDLTFLPIIYRYYPYCGHYESAVDQVKSFVLPRRPNFEFYVSCCSKFPDSRVPTEFFY